MTGLFGQIRRTPVCYTSATSFGNGSANRRTSVCANWKSIRELVRQRDDLSVELCALYNETGKPEKAAALLSSRKFQPWEGGEGLALGQYVAARIAIGCCLLAAGDARGARKNFEAALAPPQNLGEARHLLANQSDVYYWLGAACAALNDHATARRHWMAAATFRGDFQEMSARNFSELTYYSALAWQRLGKKNKAEQLLKELLAHGVRLQKTPARIDYFATSLPLMLIFDDDIQFRRETTALFLQAQAWLGLGNHRRAKALVNRVIRRNPNLALAAELASDGRFSGKRLTRGTAAKFRA